MSLTIVITQNVEERYRGFLGSAMLELAAGVYFSAILNRGTRERIWDVLQTWHHTLHNGTITMVWQSKDCSNGLGLKILGEPLKTLVDVGDFLLASRTLR